MIVILGESGSGKSTLQRYICKKNGLKSIVSTTTRPIRKNEENKIDYNFISTFEFNEKLNNKEFIEYAKYNDWNYGIELNQLINEDGYIDNGSVVVLTPHGMRILQKYVKQLKYDVDITCIYLKVDRKSRLIKLLETRDNIDECVRRSQSDVGMFDGIEDEVDIIIDNSDYRLSVETIYEQTMQRLEKRMSANV